MIFDILTIFPGLFQSFLAESLLAKALKKDLVSVNLINPRDFTSDPHRTVDDRPYGGGPGMILKPEPVTAALESLNSPDRPSGRIIYLSPSGGLLTQRKVRTLLDYPRLVLICGRYEGLDQRVIDLFVQEEISIGDYVVSGGEVPAMVIIEAVCRLIPGFLGQAESLAEESHSYGLLEHPHFTRPPEFRGLTVPRTLLSGHHAQVAAWRLAEALDKTRRLRPEFLEDPELEKLAAETLSRPASPLAPKAAGPFQPSPAPASGALPKGEPS
ncbi:MAG: tRNA (guanosine(37)-N1)-methyltransferase TrmD [Deltaproteobacteria bacterium]|jgi:tRNA (guanine37-N1)-methyltransferase|nr:tRNA (guanosine(37)-N1)-methyltransferase TrmD [Deltaproteobacteria bacterium]